MSTKLQAKDAATARISSGRARVSKVSIQCDCRGGLARELACSSARLCLVRVLYPLDLETPASLIAVWGRSEGRSVS